MDQSNGDSRHQGKGERNEWNLVGQAGSYSFTGSPDVHVPFSEYPVNSSVNHLIGSLGVPSQWSESPLSYLSVIQPSVQVGVQQITYEPLNADYQEDCFQGGGQDDAPRNVIDTTSENISGVPHHAPSDLHEYEHQGGHFYKRREPNKNNYCGYRCDGGEIVPCCNELLNGTTSQAMANHLLMHIRKECPTSEDRAKRPRETVVLQPQQGKEEEEQVAWQEEPPVKRNRPNPQAESDAAQQPLGPAQPSGGLNVRSSSAPLVQLVAQGQPVPQHASHGLGSHALAPLPQPQLLTQSYAHHGGLPEATYRHQESLGNLLALVQGRLDHEIQELNRFKLLVQLFVQEREMWAVRD